MTEFSWLGSFELEHLVWLPFARSGQALRFAPFALLSASRMTEFFISGVSAEYRS